MIIKKSNFIDFFTKIIFEQWICPPYHEKGECDSNRSVIKRKSRVFLLSGKFV